MPTAHMICGPAGVGKSTFCSRMQSHWQTLGRSVFIANLDPAADDLPYEPIFDVRELISAGDAAEELGLGPNGALLFALEFAADQSEWLESMIDGYGTYDILLLDCPGQIEVTAHVPVLPRILNTLRRAGWAVATAWLLDATFATDAAKLTAGRVAALAAMIHLECPHVNILSKADLALPGAIEAALAPTGDTLAAALDSGAPPKWRAMHRALADLLDEWSYVSFRPLDPTDEQSITTVGAALDQCIAYGEDMEPKNLAEDDAGASEAASY